MSLNSIQEIRAKCHLHSTDKEKLSSTTRFFTSDFPVGNGSVFNRSMTALIEYLTAPVKGSGFTSFWGNKTSLVSGSSLQEMAYRQCFVPHAPEHLEIKKSHVTVGFVNGSTRSQFKAALENDKVIQPLLDFSQRALNLNCSCLSTGKE